jgi:Tfp pilus assembly protein PilO
MAFDYRKEYQRYSQYYFKNLKILYSQPLTQSSLSLLLSLIVIAFFFIFALRPTILTISRLWQEIKLKKDADLKLTMKIQQLESAKNALIEANKYLKAVNNSLPTDSDFNRFEREIEWLAFKNNCIIHQLKFDKFDLFGNLIDPEANNKDKKNFPKDSLPLKFNIVLAGSYKDLKNFLSQLENLDRIVLIDSVSLSNESEIEGAQLQLSLKGSIYYLPKDFS